MDENATGETNRQGAKASTRKPAKAPKRKAAQAPGPEEPPPVRLTITLSAKARAGLGYHALMNRVTLSAAIEELVREGCRRWRHSDMGDDGPADAAAAAADEAA